MILIFSVSVLSAQKRTDADMQRWRDYGLGQFIHWGVYAIPGGQWNGKSYHGAAEWIRSWNEMPVNEYDSLYRQFNPAKFDAEKWAEMAKNMGAKYMIFTTKHHDGFCMWPSKYTAYTIANTPYKRDIVGPLVEAYSAAGIDVYLYFSIIDWNHKGYRSTLKTDADRQEYETFKQFTRNQLLELLDNYPKIKGLWFDGTWDRAWIEQAAWADSLGRELRAKIPGLIIGSRFRADLKGFRHQDANGQIIDDYDQRFERNLPSTLEETKGFDWDCVMTIPENQWGYHRDWLWTYVKTPYELIEMAVKANSLDGNLVINFGPDGNGGFRKEETDIAKEIGKWMSANGEAVYAAHHSVLEKQDWGYSTQKGDSIYLVIFNKPLNNKVRVKVPKPATKGMVNVIVKAEFPVIRKPASIEGTGADGTFYRDKNGFSYYNILIPKELQKTEMPFVIRIRLKEVDEKEAYQQAKM
ncbi:MAG: alpha-L-fucosidase [Dysgonamonadaceae bacterium]|nr:alpha-L-fucosidase [Dysgonamonadaceae bacterium]